MSSEFQEIWKFWYEAQLNEIKDHRLRYAEEKPTVRPASEFNPEADADALMKAIKLMGGFGSNHAEIIGILTKRSLEQRIQIQDKYQQLRGRNLTNDLHSELPGGGFSEKVILSLMKPLPLIYAEHIYKAINFSGTDENALIEIFCTRDDKFIRSVAESFENRYDTSIEKVLSKETSGNFKKLLVSILAFCRDDTKSSPEAVAEELCAEDITEDGLRVIVTSYTLGFLRRAFNEYKEKTGEDFLELIEKKCSLETKAAFKAIYVVSKSKAEFFTHAIHNALIEFQRDDSAFIRILVSRCEIDLETIKTKYQKLFKNDLVQRYRDNVDGDCYRLIHNLLGQFD